jgi:outer membrane lipoprotein-sorting protein
MVRMSILSSRPALRWLVPATIAVAVVGGGAAAQTIAASADPVLPERSAAQLLVDLQTAKLDGMSGTVVSKADLGLPSLPNLGGAGTADLTTLLTGSHTLRVWYSGPDKARVALLNTLGEADVIHNGRDVWAWDSRTQKAVHHVLSAEDAQRAKSPAADSLPRTPQEAADLALKSIDPTTIVTTGSTAQVAGRPAYELILSPRDTTSLVGQLRLAIDAEKHVPLRGQVFARGASDPAYEVAFTQVNFARPDDAQFRFNAPPGTTVEEAPATGPGTAADQAGAAADKAKAGTKIVGTGWTSVVVTQSAPQAAAGKRDNGAGALPGNLPKVNGDWGSGNLLTGKLFSVLFTDDGRVLAGAVEPQRLYEAARG